MRAFARVCMCVWLLFAGISSAVVQPATGAFTAEVTPQDKRGQAEGIRRQASDIVSLSAPIGLGMFADLLSAPGAIGFSAIAMAGTCAFPRPARAALLRLACAQCAEALTRDGGCGCCCAMLCYAVLCCAQMATSTALPWVCRKKRRTRRAASANPERPSLLRAPVAATPSLR